MNHRRAPLADDARRLRDGDQSTTDYLGACHETIQEREDTVHAWVDGPKPWAWTRAEADALDERYPDPASRPPLFGVPVGVKDIFHVDGLPTRAGSTLPPGDLAESQATVVTRLREAGTIVLGKTVTTEFAYFEPGPTRNPHDSHHTPGGSSSGSAAAVAAGMCPLALGTQTIGSVIRPAAFCGVVGFKPSYGRIPLDGVIPLASSVDHVGLFTQDVAGADFAAGVCIDDWETRNDVERPTLGVPADPYLDQSTETGRECFETHVKTLESTGYEVEYTSALDGIDAINDRHEALVAAEAALAHDEWFDVYEDRYAHSTADLIRTGKQIPVGTLAAARRGRTALRDSLYDTMRESNVDVWISPPAPGPAPEGIDSTGDPVMNLPWTHAGFPTVSLPGGTVEALPVGLQCAAAFGADEQLLAWARKLAKSVENAVKN